MPSTECRSGPAGLVRTLLIVQLLLACFITLDASADERQIKLEGILWEYGFYPAEHPSAVAVLFHGAGSEGPFWCDHNGAPEVLTQAGISVICPSGCSPYGVSVGECRGGAWDGGASHHPDANTLEQLGFSQDVFIDWLLDVYAIDLPVFCAGFSNGSRACAKHAAQRADLIQGALLISAPLTSQLPNVPLPMSIISSRTDDHPRAPQGLFPTFGGGKFSPDYFPAKTATTWAASNGCTDEIEHRRRPGALCLRTQHCDLTPWGAEADVELCILEQVPHSLRAYNEALGGNLWLHFLEMIQANEHSAFPSR